MEIRQNLRQRYSIMETDELIELQRKGGLTEVAAGVVDEILKMRASWIRAEVTKQIEETTPQSLEAMVFQDIKWILKTKWLSFWNYFCLPINAREGIIWELDFLFNIGNEKCKWPGVSEGENGKIGFHITEEEQLEIDLTFRSFEGLYADPQVKEKIEKGITAVALSKYASALVYKYCEGFIEKEFDLPTVKRELEKAVAAFLKAYCLYPLPIFIWRIAVALKLLGLTDQSKQSFALFLKKHVEFNIDSIDKVLLDYVGIGLDEAVSNAKSEV